MSFNLPPIPLAEMHVPVFAGSMGAVFTVIVEKFAARYRWHGTRFVHHTHNGVVPRVGGIAVMLALFAAYPIGAMFSPRIYGSGAAAALVCSIPVLLVGIYDDLHHASPKTKLLVQIAAGTGFAWMMLGADMFRSLGMFLAMGMLVFWLVLSTNSFNLIDGVDGLAAGTAAMMGLALALVNVSLGNGSLAALSLALAAACAGFLPFNLLGRRIFLGDSGSLGLGFILAAIAALTAHSGGSYVGALVLFGFPITETALTVIRRKLKGRQIFRPDREHLHHKLRNAGFSPVRTVCILYLVAAAFNSLGVMIFLGFPAWAGAAGAVLLFVAVAYGFGYCGAKTWKKLKRQLSLGEPERMENAPGYISYDSEYGFSTKNADPS